jgi:hypothetical protein
MDTSRLLSEEEWNKMGNEDRRVYVGLDGKTGNYVTLFTTYFGHSRAFDLGTIANNHYALYREWYVLEHSPLGKALR